VLVHVGQRPVNLVRGSVNATLGGCDHLCHSAMFTKQARRAAGRPPEWVSTRPGSGDDRDGER
jgi:hypothetical protein